MSENKEIKYAAVKNGDVILLTKDPSQITPQIMREADSIHKVSDITELAKILGKDEQTLKHLFQKTTTKLKTLGKSFITGVRAAYDESQKAHQSKI